MHDVYSSIPTLFYHIRTAEHAKYTQFHLYFGFMDNVDNARSAVKYVKPCHKVCLITQQDIETRNALKTKWTKNGEAILRELIC